MISLLAFLLVIAICVISHEWGHYAAAKWRGVQVHEFSFGMGPSLYGKRHGETLWSIRAIPVGGFVRLEGMEDPEEEGDTHDPLRSFPEKKPWERFVILAGGAFCNIILAWLLMAVLLMFNGVTDPSARVGIVMEGYPAAQLGLKTDDVVLAINGTKISNWVDIRSTLQKVKTDSVTVQVKRNEETLTLSGIVPVAQKEGARLLGISPSRLRYNPVRALSYSLKYSAMVTLEILKGFAKLFTGRVQSNEMAGPVGIAVMAGDAIKQGFWTFVSFLAIINLNLGLLNLLPLPALDGGRILFVLGEMVVGRKFPEEWENRLHYAGFMLLMALIALITWKDIQKYFFANG